MKKARNIYWLRVSYKYKLEKTLTMKTIVFLLVSLIIFACKSSKNVNNLSEEGGLLIDSTTNLRAINKIDTFLKHHKNALLCKLCDSINEQIINQPPNHSPMIVLFPFIMGNIQNGKALFQKQLDKGLDDLTACNYLLEEIGITLLPYKDNKVILARFKKLYLDTVEIRFISNFRFTGLGSAGPRGVIVNLTQIQRAFRQVNNVLDSLHLSKLNVSFNRFAYAIISQELFHVKNITQNKNANEEEWLSEIPSLKIAGQFYMTFRLHDVIVASHGEFFKDFQEFLKNVPEYKLLYAKYAELLKECKKNDLEEDELTHNEERLCITFLRKNPGVLTCMTKSILKK